MKKAILVASFGTMFEDTRKKNIDAIVKLVQQTYPDMPVYEAYTSSIVRKRLKSVDGIEKYSVAQAMEQMQKAGITHVSILPTHIIDGIETGIVVDEALGKSDGFEEVKIASPLLKTDSDYEKVCEAVWVELKEIVNNDSLVLMGHGSSHTADASYEIMEKKFREKTGGAVYMATVEGSVTIEDVIEKMKKEKSNKRVVVTPFMLVAGDHATNDMAGDDDSFKSRLKDAGYEPECIIKGLGEYKGIRDIYLRHLSDIIM